MKKLALSVTLMLSFGLAYAGKSCEELKTEITAKMEAKGVKSPALTIVENDKAGDAKVVGSCDGGTKKITYTKK
jgi:hypothetical protein